MPGVRLLCAVAGACAGCIAAVIAPEALVVAVPLCAAAGSHLPDFLLQRAAHAAAGATRHQGTAALDVLGAAMAAGVPLGHSLELTAGHAPPAVAAALRAAAVSVATGMEPRRALAREAERFELPVMVDVGDAVDRHRRLGTPLAPELSRIAARQRAGDRARVLERAARRGPLATLVVALVIAPVCLAALTACMIGGLVENGSLGLR